MPFPGHSEREEYSQNAARAVKRYHVVSGPLAGYFGSLNPASLWLRLCHRPSRRVPRGLAATPPLSSGAVMSQPG
jgi:hypothetical protein